MDVIELTNNKKLY